MSGALSPALADRGPLVWMAIALQARLQGAFPATYFDFAFMPQKADREWYEKYFRRGPGVAIGWNGCTTERLDGGVWMGTAHWAVALFTKNASGVANRYVGDELAPGLFAMERVAKVILHGWLVNPAGTPWQATGTTIVNATGNLYNEDWGSRDTAVCALDLTIQYEETLPPGLEQAPSDQDLQDFITWNFGEQPPLLTDTINTGGS